MRLGRLASASDMQTSVILRRPPGLASARCAWAKEADGPELPRLGSEVGDVGGGRSE